MFFQRKHSAAETSFDTAYLPADTVDSGQGYGFGGEAEESQANNIAHTMTALGLHDDSFQPALQPSPPSLFLHSEFNPSDVHFSSLFSQLTQPTHADPETSIQQLPTKSLWIGNIPQSTSVQDLITRFSAFGPLESTRVLTHKNCGFINFERVADAIEAKKALDGTLLLGSAIKINFAKVPSQERDHHQEIQHAQHTQRYTSDYQDSVKSHLNYHSTPSEFLESTQPHLNFKSSSEYHDQFQSLRNGHDIFNQRDIKTRERSNSMSSTGSIPPTMNTSPNMTSYFPNSSKASLPFINTRVLPSKPNFASFPEFSSNIETLFQNTSNSPYQTNPIIASSMTNPQFPMNQIATPHLLAMAGIPSHPIQKKPVITKPVTVQRNYAQTIPSLPELHKKYIDQSKLREVRKRLETNCSSREVEQFFDDYQAYLVELATDFIGNVVLQKIIEKGTESIRTRLIQSISPNLAAIGIHKNGTWVAQKLIDTCNATGHMQLIALALQPYIACLMLDQFGNYVVQGCLKFSNNQFVFDALSDKCMDISQGRFGARAMRSVLESGTKRQQKQVAITIVQNAYAMLGDVNGSILVTWLLDFSGLPGRYRVIAPKLLPHIGELCTNKLSALTILKIVNQGVESDAREILVQEIFSDAVLKEILVDVSGAPFIHKILSFADPKEKVRLADRVRIALSTLPQVDISPQIFKRLLEELTTITTLLNVYEEESVSPLSHPTFFSGDVNGSGKHVGNGGSVNGGGVLRTPVSGGNGNGFYRKSSGL